MKTYICYYSCPFCKNPCCDDTEVNANEMLYANSKAEARQYFNSAKQCRNMKLTRIEEYLPGFSNITVNGVKYDSFGEAINAAFCGV